MKYDMMKLIKGLFNSILQYLRSSKRILLLLLVTIIVTIIISNMIYSLLSRISPLNVPSIGNIKTIGVEAYWDSNRESKTEILNWGTFWPGFSQNMTFFLLSVSNVETVLTLHATNWYPANISDYLSLSWNYDGTALEPGDIIQVTLMLSASSSTSLIQYLVDDGVRSFDFDIIIEAHEE